MKRGREETSHETSPRPSTRLSHVGDINIPMDLIVEILKKLPAKSLVRFQSVSKQWLSIISSRKDFIESIVSRRPRDAHVISHKGSGKFYLALSPTSYTNKEILSLPGRYRRSVRGLICCWTKPHSRRVVAIYNPTTRQSFFLPEVKSPNTWSTCLFGYDPIENQYKVVFLPKYTKGESCLVFTLGVKQWRTIQGYNRPYFPLRDVVCINGAIYYQEGTHNFNICKLMRFDVRSERFHQVEAPAMLTHHKSVLINYQGKLGFVCCENGVEIWVMEETTQGWSQIFSCEMDGFRKWHVSGVTRGGEIVFDKKEVAFCNKLCVCVYYFDPKRNSMRRVGLKDYYSEERKRNYHNRGICKIRFLTVPDHVENTMCLNKTIT